MGVRRSFIDDARQAELEERGYTIVPLLTEAEAAEALARIRALQPSDGFHPVTADGAPASYHCTFLDADHGYKQAVDDLTRDLFEARTCALLDRFRMLTSNLYVKPPGTGRFEVHQNWPVTDDIRDTTLTLWCPFVPVGPENGGICVVPGSHKIVPDTFTVGADKYFASFYDELIDHWLEPLSLRPGECVLFDDSLLHWSDVNGSDEVRWSAQLVFLPEEKTPVIYHYDREHEPPRFELYEVSPAFFIDGGVEQLVQRPTHLPLVGTQPVRNVQITEDGFRKLMAEGPATRAAVYAGASVEEAFAVAYSLATAPGAEAAPEPAAPEPAAPEPVAPEPAAPATDPEPHPTPEPALAAGPARSRRRWWPFAS